MRYVYNWRGSPMASRMAAESRALSGLGAIQLSNNEKNAVMVGGAIAVWWFFFRKKRR
jgi:hypothetical protein